MLNLIKKRRSTKKFLGEVPDKRLLEEVMAAGLAAPSGRNRQSAIIVCVSDRKIRDELAKLNASFLNSTADPFYNAPVVLVVLALKDCSTRVYDGSCVMENMLLAAESLGLGACWIHRAKETFETAYGQELLKKLGIKEEYEGIGNLIIGYKDPHYAVPPKSLRPNRVYYL